MISQCDPQYSSGCETPQGTLWRCLSGLGVLFADGSPLLDQRGELRRAKDCWSLRPGAAEPKRNAVTLIWTRRALTHSSVHLVVALWQDTDGWPNLLKDAVGSLGGGGGDRGDGGPSVGCG